MAHLASPYIKVVKQNGKWLISVHKAVPGGHIMLSQGDCAAGDNVELNNEALRCIAAARAGVTMWEKQADGSN